MYRNSKIDKIVGSLNSTEKDWSKMDLIVTLDMNKEMYLNNRQRQASALLFLVCEQTRNLVDEWYNLGCDYHNIDDSPSNLTKFQRT